MKFWLGSPEDSWLKRTDVPLFVSARRLRRRKALPRAIGPWALDSGGFTELTTYGRWTVDAMTYSAEARRWRDRVGNMAWCAPCDWMCEPVVIEGGRLEGRQVPGTKLSVRIHQDLTVRDYLLLRQLAPDLPWVPVLQGWGFDDYLRCVEMYGERGVDLASQPLVGLGSVCRRQDTGMAKELIAALSERGLRLHGFGFKVGGLLRCASMLSSADSMAWSRGARWGRKRASPDCTHRKCTNCLPYALAWRERVSRACEAGSGPRQLELFANPA